jgi:hypothetical protein
VTDLKQRKKEKKLFKMNPLEDDRQQLEEIEVKFNPALVAVTPDEPQLEETTLSTDNTLFQKYIQYKLAAMR